MNTTAFFDFLHLRDKVRCVDVGALAIGGEARDPWIDLCRLGCAELVGFEPIPEECDKLNTLAASISKGIRYLPHAIGDGHTHTLHVTNVPMTSSLFEPDTPSNSLFANLAELMVVTKKLPVETQRLDDLDLGGPVDFLKLDIQGAELMALENAPATLESVSVLQCEVEFVPLYKNQPLFGDIDRYLRSRGFQFLRFAYTMGRPFKPLVMNNNPNQSISQTLWADAVYVKDFRALRTTPDRLLRAGTFILHEMYKAFDLAHLFLTELDRRHQSDLARRYLQSLLSARK
jgi:FkbM family methyltransferase